jgi:hypothetical protein
MQASPFSTVIGASIALLTTLAAPCAHAQSTEFSNGDLGVTLRIPDGWKAIPEKTLQASAHQKDLGNNGEVLAGYARAGTSLTPPYIVIDGWAPDFDYSQATWNDIINFMHLTTIEQARDQGLLDGNGKFTGKGLSPSILDRDRKVIIMQGEVPREPGSTKPGLFIMSASFLGKSDFLRIHAYLPADRAKALMPEVQWVFDSVKFEPGFAFEPYRAKSRSSSSSGGRYRYGYYGGGGFAIVIGLRYLLYWLSSDD